MALLYLDDYHDCKINIHTLSERLVQSDYDDGWKFRIAPTEDNMANIRKHEDDVVGFLTVEMAMMLDLTMGNVMLS